LEQLLFRLEVDVKPAVNAKIASLLHNSFWPSTDEEDPKEEAKIVRAVFLVKKNRGAARRFYEHCQKRASVHECVKFVLAVLVRLRQFVKEDSKREAVRECSTYS